VSFGTVFPAVRPEEGCCPLYLKSPGSVRTGRPQSIPVEIWPEVIRLYGQGLGYRRVANALIPLKIWTTKSSVERLIKGRPPYQDRRPCGRKRKPLF